MTQGTRLELTTKPRLTRMAATTRPNHSLTISLVRLWNARRARLNVRIGVRSARSTARLLATRSTDVSVDRKLLEVFEALNRDPNEASILATVDAADITETSTVAVPDRADTVAAIPTIVHCAITATRTMMDATTLRTVRPTARNLRTSQHLWLPTNFQR